MEQMTSARQALTGWIIGAACFVVAGVGAAIWAERSRGGEVPAEVVASWRDYAEMVQQGRRTPIPATTQLLTETAIAQNAYAASAVQLLRVLGLSVAIVGIVLLLDLLRYRAAHCGTATGSSHIRWVIRHSPPELRRSTMRYVPALRRERCRPSSS
jgi:hypothetical protein